MATDHLRPLVLSRLNPTTRRDYKHIEGLGQYETEGIDGKEYRAIGNRARERAEMEMRKRDREKMKNDSD